MGMATFSVSRAKKQFEMVEGAAASAPIKIHSQQTHRPFVYTHPRLGISSYLDDSNRARGVGCFRRR